MKVQKILKTMIQKLPRQWRGKIHRRLLNLPYDLDPNLQFKMADNDDELRQAFRILHDSYVEVGLMVPHSTGMRITEYHSYLTSIVLIVKRGNEVLGTVTVIRDHVDGLPCDKLYDIDDLRRPGRVVAEISALAIKKEWRGKLFFPFMKYMIETTFYGLGINTAVIVAHSHWSQFYEDLLIFRPLTKRKSKDYAFGNNLPVEGSYLNLDEAEALHGLHYANQKLEKNLFHYFWLHRFPHFKYINEKFHTIVNPCYRSRLLRDPFLPEKNRLSGRHRVPTELNALVQIGHRTLKATVKNISSEGLRINFPKSQLGLKFDAQEQSELSLKIQCGPFYVSRIRAKEVWSNAESEMGLRVIQGDSSWNDYLSFLQVEPSPIGDNVIQYEEQRMNQNSRLVGHLKQSA